MNFDSIAFARESIDRWLILSGALQWAAEPDQGELSFYAPDFALSSKNPWLTGGELTRLTAHEIAVQSPSDRQGLEGWSEPSFAEFSARHREILEKIRALDFQKVVPAVFAEGKMVSDWSTLLPPLLNAGPTQHPYGFHFRGEGLIGVTPEILFTLQGRDFTTMAVAGTALLNGKNLLQDEKEMHEHELVIEDLANQLVDIADLKIGETVERPAGHLKHLATPISGVLRKHVDFEDLVRRLHPSAALGGYPRHKTAEWLQSQPEYSVRNRFGAPFGWRWRDGHGVCLVAIRNLQWRGSKAWIGSGCGVVEGSQVDREWIELNEKRGSVRRNLGLEA